MSTAFPVASRGFWRAYAVTLRPYLSFVSLASGMPGLALAPMLEPPLLAAALAAFFLSYGVGQALTDVFQCDTDSLSAPYRPLVRGEITTGAVLVVSLIGLAGCAAVFAALNPRSLVLTVACIGGLASYTPMKRRFWAGPLWNAWIVALLPAVGALCGERTTAWPRHPLLPAAMASAFFSYAVFVALGYLKDVEADARTGYDTLPVRFGRRATVIVSGLLCAAAIGVSARMVVGAGSLASATTPAALLWTAGLALLLWAHRRLWSTTRDDEAHPGVALTLRGFVALHLGEAALVRPSLAVPGLVLLALGEVALAARPCREQI